MGYENTAGLGVNNHYGPRASGGTEGVAKTEGVNNEFVKDLDEAGLAFGFPVPSATQGSNWVTECDISQAAGTVTAQTIGGVDISGATPEAPVEIDSTNTGVIAMTGSTGGLVLIKFKKYPRV